MKTPTVFQNMRSEAVLWWHSIYRWERDNERDITPRMLPKRSFLAGKWKRGELQKRFSIKAFFPQNLTSNKVALKTFTFQPDSFQCKIAIKGGEMPDNGELQTFMHFSNDYITFHNSCIRESSWNGYTQTNDTSKIALTSDTLINNHFNTF